MGNEVTTIPGRAISTPEGKLALQRISSSVALRCAEDGNEVQARQHICQALIDDLPVALAEAKSRIAPALGADFKRSVTPAVSLVVPAGMSQGDVIAWTAAAAKALSGMPADLLERGCAAATRVVDHPSKIVPAIFREVQGEWDRRKALVSQIEHLRRIADAPAPEVVEDEPLSPEDRVLLDRLLGKEPGSNVAPPVLRVPTMQEITEVLAIGQPEVPIEAVAPESYAGMTVEQILADATRRRRIREMSAEVGPDCASIAVEMEEAERDARNAA